MIDHENLPDPRKVGKRYKKTTFIYATKMLDDFQVKTLEGVMIGRKGDYLVMGIKGELWPIAENIFNYTIYPECPYCGSSSTYYNEVSQIRECRVCNSEFEVREDD